MELMRSKMEKYAHLCVTKEIIRSADLWAVRWITEGDSEAFVEPFWKGGERGWTIEEFRELQESGYSYCGIFLNGRLCSIAGVWRRRRDVWEVIAVGTKQEYRHRGMARSVVHFAAEHILQHVKVASYTARESNIASIRTAQSVGFRYCTNIVDNNKWCIKIPRPSGDTGDNPSCPLCIQCEVNTV